MREIKFRMFDTLEKNFMNDSRVLESRLWDLQDNERFIYQQYTGLLDKNGKEIYEGDIIRDNDGFLWEVYFEDGMYRAKGGEFELSECLIEFCPEWCEVIGNIYANPELLEVSE
jgi:YopX protein